MEKLSLGWSIIWGVEFVLCVSAFFTQFFLYLAAVVALIFFCSQYSAYLHIKKQEKKNK